jgi:hypothetical protein
MFAAAIVAGLWVWQHRPPFKRGMDIEFKTVEVYIPERIIEPATSISWDDLKLGVALDDLFDPQHLRKEIRELQGKRVQIAGTMSVSGVMSLQVDHFLLERNRQNRLGRRGPPDESLTVQIRKGRIATFTHETVRVTGILRIAPVNGDDGSTWSIYRVEDATVEKIP